MKLDMKKHIAKVDKWHKEKGRRVYDSFKSLCGIRAESFEEAKSKGFMKSLSPDNKDGCKTCQNIMSNTRYWKEYRKISTAKRRYV